MKKTTMKIITAFLALVFILSAFSMVSYAEDSKLRFKDDGKFTILQIADPQDDRYLAHELIPFIEKAIELSKPDLVVFTGDTVENSRIADIAVDDEGWREGVTVKKDYEKTLSNTKAACDQIFSTVNDKGIPFAVSQGNNDYSSTVKNEDWLKIYSSYENCFVKDESNDSEGRIDYSVSIYSSKSEKIAFNIYMMDTKKEGVTDEQIDWYISKSNALKEENSQPVKAFVFEHIPVAEVGNLFVKCKPFDKGAISKGTAFYKLGPNASGHAEVYYAPGETCDQFAAWKQQGDVIGAYFGHIHTDGFTGVYDDIELGLTYGCQFAKSGPYGVRVITLDENDISNYDNTLYTYSKGKFTLQENDAENNFSFIAKFVSLIRRLFSFIFV